MKSNIITFLVSNFIFIVNNAGFGYCLIVKELQTIISYYPYFTVLPYCLLIYKSLNHPIIFNNISKEHFSFQISETKNKKNQPLSDKQIDSQSLEIYNKVVHSFESEKSYLNSELTLKDISDQFQISVHQNS